MTSERPSGIALRCPYCSDTISPEFGWLGYTLASELIGHECDSAYCDASWDRTGSPERLPRDDSFTKP